MNLDMGIYKGYVKESFNNARTEYRDAWEILKGSELAYSDAKKLYLNSRHKSAYIAMQKAEVRYLEAQANWNNAKSAFDKFGQELKLITADAMEYIEKAHRIDPSKIDSDTMTLLNSGICKADDIERLAERHKGNMTMLRLIASHAEKLTDGADPETKRKLYGVMALSNDTNIRQDWDDFTKKAIIASGIDYQRRHPILNDNPDLRISRAEAFEKFIGEA